CSDGSRRGGTAPFPGCSRGPERRGVPRGARGLSRGPGRTGRASSRDDAGLEFNDLAAPIRTVMAANRRTQQLLPEAGRFLREAEGDDGPAPRLHLEGARARLHGRDLVESPLLGFPGVRRESQTVAVEREHTVAGRAEALDAVQIGRAEPDHALSYRHTGAHA